MQVTTGIPPNISRGIQPWTTIGRRNASGSLEKPDLLEQRFSDSGNNPFSNDDSVIVETTDYFSYDDNKEFNFLNNTHKYEKHD